MACELDISCAKVHIGVRDGRLGSMSMLVNAEGEELIEGISFLNKLWPKYDGDQMYDPETQEYYSIHHIFDATRDYVPTSVWIEMLFFDFLIGNTDRHQNNWALITTVDGSNMRRAPLYDKGSSLCCYVREEEIPFLLGKDKNRFRALTDTKSRSLIRINPQLKKHPTHREMIRFLLEKYPRIAKPAARKMAEIITKDRVTHILCQVRDSLTVEREELIGKILLEKINYLQDLLKLREYHS